MNPVEQLMQSIGASSSPALAGLFGASSAASSKSPDASAQFAAALQSMDVSSTDGVNAAIQGFVDTGKVDPSVSPAELLAALGISLPADITNLPQQFSLTAALSTPATDSTGTMPASAENQGAVEAAINPFAVLQQLPEQAAGAHASGLPVLPSSALEQLGLKLEQLPALPSTEQLAETASAGLSTSSHLMPAAAVDGLISMATEKSPVLSLSADGSAVTLTTPVAPQEGLPTDIPGASLTEGLTTAAMHPQLISGEPSAQPTADSMQQPAVNSAVAAAAVDAPAAPRSDASAAPIVANASAGSDAPEQVDPQAQAAAATTSPEGHAVTAGAGQTAGTANSANTPASNSKGARVGAPQSTEAMPDATKASTDRLPDALTTKAVEAATARPEATAANHATVPPRETATLTPERLAGLPDASATSTVASGLSGMRGESTFMSSMGLLGGKDNPQLAQHVAQQMNMNVTRAMKDGLQEFTVRLNPNELGHVRVKMSFLEDGRVQAKVMAERPETLQLLQKDTRGFERALEAGGQKVEGNVEFSLDTNDQQSAGRAFAEALQQEKMRDELAARSGLGAPEAFAADEFGNEEIIPLDDILANVSVETGLDISV